MQYSKHLATSVAGSLSPRYSYSMFAGNGYLLHHQLQHFARSGVCPHPRLCSGMILLAVFQVEVGDAVVVLLDEGHGIVVRCGEWPMSRFTPLYLAIGEGRIVG